MFGLVAAAAMAVATNQQQEQPIVVTAPVRPTYSTARRQAMAFVHDVTERSLDQVSRFHDPVCPAVIGLSNEHAQTVRDRIIETARGIGARVDTSRKCSANLTLIVAEDSRAFVRDVRRKRPGWLGGLSPSQVSEVITGPGPVRAWSVSSIANELGGSRHTPDWDEKYDMLVLSSSILDLPTRVQMEGSFVVIDRAAALGLSLAQLADYAAMRGLARTRAPERKTVSSILNLFEPGSVRQHELTRSDVIYLQTLYRSRGTESVPQQRAQLARAMAEDAAGARK